MAFFDLTNNSDFRAFNPGELRNFFDGVRGFDGNDTLLGSTDSESFNGNIGNDSLQSNFGFDYVLGGRDNDTLDGNGDNDTVNGNIGDDSVRGGDNDDIVRGGQGNDELFGDRGSDTLIGDFGVDDLTGGENSDLFVLRTDTAAFGIINGDAVRDFNPFEGDRIGFDTRITTSEITFDDSLDYSNIFGGSQNVDTVISITSSGLILGVVLDTTINDVVSRIEIVPDSTLFIG